MLPRNALLSACKRCAPDFHPLLPSLFGLIMPWIIGPSICDLTDCPPLNYPTYLSDARARQYTRVCSPPPLDRLGKLTQIGSLVTLQTLVLGLAYSSFENLSVLKTYSTVHVWTWDNVMFTLLHTSPTLSQIRSESRCNGNHN